MGAVNPFKDNGGVQQEFGAGDYLAVASGGTGAITALGARENLGVNNSLDHYNSTSPTNILLAQTIDFNRMSTVAAFGNANSNNLWFMPLGLALQGTISGLVWYQGAVANITATNNNKVAIMSLSGSTLSVVAQSTNDATLWSQAGANVYKNKAFSASFTAVLGTSYFAAILYCNSAAATSPTIGFTSTMASSSMGVPQGTSVKLYTTLTGGGATDIPSSQAMSGLTATNSIIWLAAY